MDGTWTIGELAELAAGALTADPLHQLSGRVRELPNDRLIRWYATVGLVDPPLSRTGRIARYGRRHLLQLVAVKRRQAQGLSLTEIQAELLGAPDSYLESVARLPAADAQIAVSAFDQAGTGRLVERPTVERPDVERPDAERPDAERPDAERPDAGSQDAGDRFWRRRPVPDPASQVDPAASAAPARPGSAAPTAPAPPESASPAPAVRAELIRGVRLAPGVLLLLDGNGAGSGWSPADAAELRSAAGPLLTVLARQGYRPETDDQERNRP
jgi:DNA-binding transcriptional MerR regulator